MSVFHTSWDSYNPNSRFSNAKSLIRELNVGEFVHIAILWFMPVYHLHSASCIFFTILHGNWRSRNAVANCGPYFAKCIWTRNSPVIWQREHMHKAEGWTTSRQSGIYFYMHEQMITRHVTLRYFASRRIACGIVVCAWYKLSVQVCHLLGTARQHLTLVITQYNINISHITLYLIPC